MIKIADRFRPFSHTPGSTCMIPRSGWAVEAYPLEFRLFYKDQNVLLKLHLTGPVDGFTLEQDLENEVVRIFGKAKEGYFNFQISHLGNLVKVALNRGEQISYNFLGKDGVLQRGQDLEILSEEAFPKTLVERLSLGLNKKLDWDLVLKRCDLRELYPALFLLGQKTRFGTSDFVLNDLALFVKYHFDNLLFPKRQSDNRLGVLSQNIPDDIQLSHLLYKAYAAIRALFILEEDAKIFLLPDLPKEFVFGRLLGLKTGYAIFDLEWSKRKLHKVRIMSLQNGFLSIVFPSDVDSFRIKYKLYEKGKMVSATDRIEIRDGQIIYLDKFQK